MNNLINMDFLREVSDRDENPLYLKIIKLSEEAGEVSAAFLDLDASPNASASASTDNPRSAVIEEVCDTILVSMDILYSLGATDTEIREMMDRKLSKWNKKFHNLGK